MYTKNIGYDRRNKTTYWKLSFIRIHVQHHYDIWKRKKKKRKQRFSDVWTENAALCKKRWDGK